MPDLPRVSIHWANLNRCMNIGVPQRELTTALNCIRNLNLR